MSLTPAATLSAQTAPTAIDEAWRTSLDAFGKKVVAVAEKSDIPDASVQIKHIREHSVLMNAKGEDLWATFRQGFGNEFHGKLAEKFSGPVSWRGVVDSVETNTKVGVYIIKVKSPLPSDMPKGIEFEHDINLSIPISKLPAANLPAKGSEFAFRGNLKKMKEYGPAPKDDIAPPILVYYGLGPNAGKTIVRVNLVDVEPLNN
jgi:hypothetical protein